LYGGIYIHLDLLALNVIRWYYTPWHNCRRFGAAAA